MRSTPIDQARLPEDQCLRSRSLFEIVLVYGIIEAALWTEGAARYWCSLLALLVVVIIGVERRDLWPKLGLGGQGLVASLWIVPASAALAGGILLPGHVAGTLHAPYGRFWYVAIPGYLLWAFQQQYLLQSFFFTRLESLMGDGWRPLLATVLLFSLAHIPNPILMAATLAMAVVFCLLFRRYRNIYALAVAHAMLGLSLAAVIPEPLVRHMRVGIGYLRYVSK